MFMGGWVKNFVSIFHVDDNIFECILSAHYYILLFSILYYQSQIIYYPSPIYIVCLTIHTVYPNIYIVYHIWLEDFTKRKMKLIYIWTFEIRCLTEQKKSSFYHSKVGRSNLSSVLTCQLQHFLYFLRLP